MSGDPDRQSSSDVAHEAEGTRASLASTLEQLRLNLKPENVMDEVVSNARAGAASVADSVSELARQYPLPSLLVGTGAAFMLTLFGKRKGTGSLRSPALAEPSVQRPLSPRNSVRFESNPRLSANRLPRVGSGRWLTADGGHTVSPDFDMRGRTADRFRSSTTRTGDAMQSTYRSLPNDSGVVKSKLSNLLDEQPLILGAIGLAIGAAIGAALPITKVEDDLMGSTAHQMRQSAGEIARHEVDGLRTVAGEAFDNVKQSAVDHGLSTDNLNDLVKDVGDHAKTAVNRVGSSLETGKTGA